MNLTREPETRWTTTLIGNRLESLEGDVLLCLLNTVQVRLGNSQHVSHFYVSDRSVPVSKTEPD